MFPGHTKNWDHLLNEARAEKLPPAYLFYGIPDIGKKNIALTFVQWLFCQEHPDTLLPCLKCPSCTRIIANQHPDFFLFDPPPGKTIKIDELRALQNALHKAPLEAPLKVVVINQAQDLTLGAANSLLKILEEPPNRTLFILIAPALFRLLPTIRSRCRRLYFLPAAEKNVYEAPLFLREGKKSFSQLSQKAKEWAEREVDLELFLERLKGEVFDEMVRTKNWDDAEKIDRMSRAQKDIRGNVNKILVLENLLMDLNV